jgi:hypothetical protein
MLFPLLGRTHGSQYEHIIFIKVFHGHSLIYACIRIHQRIRQAVPFASWTSPPVSESVRPVRPPCPQKTPIRPVSAGQKSVSTCLWQCSSFLWLPVYSFLCLFLVAFSPTRRHRDLNSSLQGTCRAADKKEPAKIRVFSSIPTWLKLAVEQCGTGSFAKCK